MSAFESGFKMGGDMWDSAEQSKRQKVLDARATRDDEQKQTAIKRQLGIQSQLDDAYKYSTALDGGIVKGRTADFSGVNPMADQGPVPQEQMAPVVGMRPQGAALDSPAPALVSTPATQRDRLNIARTIATLKQDDAGIARINEQGLVLDRKDDQRNFISRVQTLSKDPGKAAEYAQEIAPAIKAFSEFEGMPSNYHFDPKTKGIIETPYGKKDSKTGAVSYGKSREVPLEEMLPYMLAHRNLVSEYGDPETAAAAIKTMKDGERVKRLEEAKQTLEAATKLSSADSSQTTAKAHMVSAGAAVTSAGAAVMNARTNEGLRQQQVADMKDMKANRVAAAGFAADYGNMTPEQQASPEGRGLLRQFNMANVKNGAQVQLDRPAGGSAAAAKYEIDNVWSDISKKLIGDGNIKDLPAAKDAFYGSRGFAPDSAVNQLMDPRKPDGSKRTAADIADFNRHFPNSPIEASKVPWMNAPPPPNLPNKPAGMLTKAEAAANRSRAGAAISDWVGNNIGPGDGLRR